MVHDSIEKMPIESNTTSKMPPPSSPTTVYADSAISMGDRQESVDDKLRVGQKRKRDDLGRNEWRRTQPDKRARAGDKRDDAQSKTEPRPPPSYAIQFPEEEIAADERKPKRKVAVMIGYSGTGYKGMQLTPDEKTIEGDLFSAFIQAGAISKANANDPKKSSLVRCARTDKGVHAAGNIVSLKLIIEDPEIVKKINDHLSPQIRVWGIQRTNGAFNCYQMCDSRVYEYMIPTHCFLPPHPSSYLGRKLVQLAEEAGDLEAFRERQVEVSTFWDDVEKEHIQPILENLDPAVRAVVMKALYDVGETPIVNVKLEEAREADGTIVETFAPDKSKPLPRQIEEAAQKIRNTYLAYKRAYRLPQVRLDRITAALAQYTGTKNYHNYTVHKDFRDPSASRVIRSFNISRDPIISNGTEWLSLKVHGQSFMMHQIRKMVGMVALAVRCGADVEKIMKSSFQREKMSIPKAPGLGLLLERPIFESWNKKAVERLGREGIDFGKYEKEIEEFKGREIYERIFREEESFKAFHNLFNHIDNWQDSAFLWASSMGNDAVRAVREKQVKEVKKDIEDEKDGKRIEKAILSASAAAPGVESEDEAVAGAEEG